MHPTELSTTFPSSPSESRRAPPFRPGQSGNPNGRARKRVATRLLGLIEEMAARACTQEHIALACGMSAPTWKRCRDEDQAVADALLRGRSRLRDELVTTLLERARSGDVVPLLFALKALFGFRDQGPEPGETHPTVIINLPASLPMAEYAKAITVEQE